MHLLGLTRPGLDVHVPLTDTAVRQAKPTGENHTLKDTAGLALFVGAKGAKQRHSRFYWLGKQARLSMSVYPTVSLKHDREARDQARDLVAQGGDPQIERHFTKGILPWLGDLPIVEVSRQHVLEVLRKIERRKAMTTAEKCRTWFPKPGPRVHNALPSQNSFPSIAGDSRRSQCSRRGGWVSRDFVHSLLVPLGCRG